MQSEPIAAQDVRNFHEVPDKQRGAELKKERNIENEITCRFCPGLPFDDRVSKSHRKGQHRKDLENRRHRRVIERQGPQDEVDEVEKDYSHQQLALGLLGPGQV